MPILLTFPRSTLVSFVSLRCVVSVVPRARQDAIRPAEAEVSTAIVPVVAELEAHRRVERERAVTIQAHTPRVANVLAAVERAKLEASLPGVEDR